MVILKRLQAKNSLTASFREKYTVKILILFFALIIGQLSSINVAGANNQVDFPSQISIEIQNSFKKPDEIKVQVILDKQIPDPIDRDYVITLLIYASDQKNKSLSSEDKCFGPTENFEVLFATGSNFNTEPIKLNRYFNDGKPTLKPYKEIPKPEDFAPVGEEFIFIEKHANKLIDNPTILDCAASWWIESTYINRDTWAFVTSASCLGLHKLNKQRDEFNYFYTTAFITSPDREALRSSEESYLLPKEGLKFGCWSTTSKGDIPMPRTNFGFNVSNGTDIALDGEEQCSIDAKEWVIDFECSPFPNADIEFLRGGKWVRKQAVLRGTSSAVINKRPFHEEKCKGNQEDPYHYVANASFGPKYRIKFFGLKGVSNTLVEVKTSQGVVSFNNKRYSSSSQQQKSDTATSSSKQVCVSATGEGYAEEFSIPAQCTDSGGWELQYCDVHPTSELQAYKSGKWRKVKSVNASKSEICTALEQPYLHVIKSSEIAKHRIRLFGNKAYNSTFLNLKIVVNP